MAYSGAKFGRKQEEAIAALLTQATIEKAARVAGIGTRTLMRWLQVPEFQAAYRKARQDALSQSIARLEKGSPAAVATLFNVMAGPGTPASVRVHAANCFLNHTWKGAEIDAIDSRIPQVNRDSDWLTELGSQLAGILRGIVENAATCRRISPGLPPCVIAAESRRREPDRLREFFQERCVVAAKGNVDSWKRERCWVPVAELYPTYVVWAAAHSDGYTLPKGSFEERLHELRLEKGRVRPARGRGTKQVWVWLGIRFNTAGQGESVPCDRNEPV